MFKEILLSELNTFKDLETVFNIATRIVKYKNLSFSDLGYHFKFNNRKRAAGLCNYSRKLIALSKPIFDLNLKDNPEFIVDTLLHEIAHAIAYEVYKDYGHGVGWKKVCVAIGAKPERCFSFKKDNIIQPNSKYTLLCSHCGKITPVNRRPKYNKSCGTCYPKKYNDDFKMTLTQNY